MGVWTEKHNTIVCSLSTSHINTVCIKELNSVSCFIQYAAAAAAKSLQSCQTLCDPIDSSPPGSSVPGILQARTGVGCHFLLQCMKVKSESEVAQSCPTLSDPMDCSLPGSSMGFSRQQYWSGVPLPSPSLLNAFLISQLGKLHFFFVLFHCSCMVITCTRYSCNKQGNISSREHWTEVGDSSLADFPWQSLLSGSVLAELCMEAVSEITSFY